MTPSPQGTSSQDGRNRDTTTTGRPRIGELDVIRGFALCGIHVVNIYQQVVFAAMFDGQRALGLTEMPAIVRYGFYERFLPTR